MQRNGIYFFCVMGRYFAFDVNTTFCTELDSIALSVLPELMSGTGDNLAKKYANVYPTQQLHECITECKNLLDNTSFGTMPSRYHHQIQDAVTTVCLHVAHHCNLNCEYCYADTGSFGGTRRLMSRQIMMQAVDLTFARSGNHKKVNVGFFGGEPLINFKLIRECVEYAKGKANELNKQVTFSMASNAVLLTPNIMDFLARENFSLLFSLDGPQHVHDRMRKTRNGRKTHALVLRNIKRFAKIYPGEFTVRGTFTRTTPNFSEQVLFLNEHGFKSVAVEPAQLAENSPHSITSMGDIARIMYEYDKLAGIYLERFNKGNPIYFYHFDDCLRKLLRPRPVHTECGAGSGYIAVTPDGKIFPCFEAVAEKENCIGHINTGFNKQKRKTFQRMHADVKKECRSCWMKYACGGGCHAFNIRFNRNIEAPYKIHCEFIKHRFKLSAWILAEIMDKGEKSVKALKKHLQVE